MFHIFTQTHFSAGHHLRDYPGNCERPHGHNWKVEVTIQADQLDHLGMGVDFRTVKQAVAQVIGELDHCNLNELPAFQEKNPSSENIAVYIFGRLQQEITTEHYRPHAVTVYETESSGVTYFG